MKKTISLILGLTLIILIGTLKATASQSLLLLAECDKLFSTSNAFGAFCYGYKENYLYSATLFPDVQTHKIKVNGNIKSVCHSEKFTYALFLVDYQEKHYCIAEFNTVNGITKFYDFTLPIEYTKNTFAVTNNSIYFINNDSIYSFVVEYSKNGVLLNEYKFESNVIGLITNNNTTYCRLDNGDIYSVNNKTTLLCTKTNPSYKIYNCGPDFISDSNGTFYSLTDKNYIQTTTTKGLYQISANNNRFKYIYGQNVFNHNNESIKLNTNPLLIASYKNETIIIDENYNYKIIKDTDFIIDEPTTEVTTKYTNNNNKLNLKINSENIIYGIKNGTLISQLKSSFTSESSVRDKNGNITNSGILKTGQTVEVDNHIYTISVCGDITGEGNVNSKDISSAMDFRISKTKLYGAYKNAADFNLDGVINNIDIVLISRKATK